jgi:ABC-type transporter Mla maintaining outer membrane lipid asymmetry permease subunit MlaE
MNHEVLPFVLAAILGLVWVYLSTLLLLRAQGGKISWNPIKFRGKKLTEVQDYLGLGVLGFGVGTFIFDLADRYIRSRLYGNPLDQLHFESVIKLLFSALLGGVIFGLLFAFIDSVFGEKRATRS